MGKVSQFAILGGEMKISDYFLVLTYLKFAFNSIVCLFDVPEQFTYGVT